MPKNEYISELSFINKFAYVYYIFEKMIYIILNLNFICIQIIIIFIKNCNKIILLLKKFISAYKLFF